MDQKQLNKIRDQEARVRDLKKDLKEYLGELMTQNEELSTTEVRWLKRDIKRKQQQLNSLTRDLEKTNNGIRKGRL